ncbi:MAG TPA: endonuclease [Holosporales bacterium]|nr:endonuclease [Holosporales bacterium]
MDELELLHQQIAELQSKAKELAEKKREPIIEEMKNKIKLYGITAKELGLSVGSSSTETTTTAKTPVAIKYRSGDNTWTGRGRQPKFIVDHIANGGKIEDLLV